MQAPPKIYLSPNHRRSLLENHLKLYPERGPLIVFSLLTSTVFIFFIIKLILSDVKNGKEINTIYYKITYLLLLLFSINFYVWRLDEVKKQKVKLLKEVEIYDGIAFLHTAEGDKIEFVINGTQINTGYRKAFNEAWVSFGGQSRKSTKYMFYSKMPREEWLQLQRDLAAHLREANHQASAHSAGE